MDLEHYRNFITIVDCGNLSAASEVLHIAQPALTMQVKNLRKKYGTELLLVRRGARSIELTDAGRVLYAKAKYLCNIEASVQREINSTLRGVQGKLALSISPSTAPFFIKKYLCGFAKLNPKVEFDIYEGDSAAHTRELINGVTEISISPLPLEQASRFEILSTDREQLGAIFHQSTSWVSPDKTSLEVKDLESVPLCLSRGCQEFILSNFANAHISPHVLCVNSTKHSAITWARQQSGVAIVPISISDELGPELRCLHFQDDRFSLRQTISVVKSRPLSSVAQNFLKYYHEH